MSEEVLYSDSFQLKFLAEAARNSDFANSVLPNVTTKNFTKDWFTDIFRVLADYVTAYKSSPLDAETFLDHFVFVANRNKALKLTDNVTTIVTNIYKKTSDGKWEFEFNAKDIHDKANDFVRRAAYREALLNSIHKVETDNYEEIRDLILKAGMVGIPAESNFQQSLKEIFIEDDRREEGQLLGYKLNKFHTMETYLDGIQPGFYVIAAHTSYGKTALSINLLLDILQSNDVCGLYVSLDDSRKKIVHRFLGIMSGLPINEVQSRKTDPETEMKLYNARDTLKRLAETNKLDIRDISSISNIETLEGIIRSHPKRDQLVVVLDGLYNLEVSNRDMDKRAENIKRANRIKALVDLYGIPVICTGELRKWTKTKGEIDIPDISDLMETSKFSYNANVVFLLHYPDTGVSLIAEEPILKIEYAKNKQSHFRGTQNVRFRRRTGVIEELGSEEAETINTEQAKEDYLKMRRN